MIVELINAAPGLLPSDMTRDEDTHKFTRFLQLIATAPKTIGDKYTERFREIMDQDNLRRFWLTPSEVRILKMAETKANNQIISESSIYDIVRTFTRTMRESERVFEILSLAGLTIEFEHDEELSAEEEEFAHALEEVVQSDEVMPWSEQEPYFRELTDRKNPPTAERRKVLMEILFQANQRLCPYVIGKLPKYARNVMLSDEDELAVANYQLIRLFTKFEVERGNRFTTFAVTSLGRAIMRYRYANRYLHHVPENIHNLYLRMVKAKNAVQERGEEPLPEKIVDEYNRMYPPKPRSSGGTSKPMTVPWLTRIMETAHAESISLHSPIPGMDDIYYEEAIQSDDISVEERVEDQTLKDSLYVDIRDILSRLDAKEEDVLRLKFGIIQSPEEVEYASLIMGRPILPGEQVRMDEMAKVFGVTKERIRQIEGQARRKLRNPMVSLKLIEYMS